VWLIQHVLDQDRVDVDQAELEQMQRENRQLLFLGLVVELEQKIPISENV
jgi:hypothetical protein